MSLPNYYLVASSNFFIIPALYGLYQGYTLLPMASLITTISSINYWLEPSNVIKKNMNLITSKSCGLIYLVHAYYSIDSIYVKVIVCVNLWLLITAYNISCILYNRYNQLWIPYNVMFHFLICLCKLTVL